MNKNLSAVIQKHIENTIEAFRRKRFEAHYLPTKEALLAELSKRLSGGLSCSAGGSLTLKEAGVLEFLEKGGDFRYINRYAPGVNDIEVCRQALTCDVYLSGTNAVTMEGELYNVDGQGNRVAALSFGPEKVIVIVGYNKIVADIPAAKERMRHFCAPANVVRLGRQNPCAVTGVCQNCASPERICAQELVTSWQEIPERICVFILGEQYGF